MVEYEIWGSISAYIKNWLVSLSNDKEILSRVNTINWNFLKGRKRKKKKKTIDRNGALKTVGFRFYYIYIYIYILK